MTGFLIVFERSYWRRSLTLEKEMHTISNRVKPTLQEMAPIREIMGLIYA